MIPREIHDPAVLAIIEKECRFMVGKCTAAAANSAYRNLANAAHGLGYAIQHGRSERALCPICKRVLRLKLDGTFRYHSGCPADSKTPKEAERFRESAAVDPRETAANVMGLSPKAEAALFGYL